MNEPEPIAERIVYAVSKSGHGFQIRLMVGRPYQEGAGNWACRVALDGFHERLPDVRGENSWQALILAIRLAKTLLGFFIEDGGRLYWEADGEEMSLNDLFWDEPISSEPEVPQPDGPLSPEEEELAESLSAEELQAIDEAILTNCSKQFRKVARVVMHVMDLESLTGNSLPDAFYADRIYKLVESGVLISEGKIGYMRFCEVRLPQTD